MEDLTRTGETALPTDDLRVLFDVAVESLDFASGFLDYDEVRALRRVARVLGVDPAKATPSGFTGEQADCEHPDWEINEKKWTVAPERTVVWNGRSHTEGERLEWEPGSDIGVLHTLAFNGDVIGPSEHWNRRCRVCGATE